MESDYGFRDKVVSLSVKSSLVLFSHSVRGFFCQQFAQGYSDLCKFGYESTVVIHKSKEASHLQSFDIL